MSTTRPTRRQLATVALLALPPILAAAAGGRAGSVTAESPRTAAAVPAAATDTAAALASLGIPVTSGAAPGYVDDRLCADCHGSIARSFADVGMARSFYPPSRAAAIERFDQPFEHAASGHRFAMAWRGEELWFRRWLDGGDGAEAFPWEVRVDWVLGSGNSSRTYLYRTPSGELWQLPIAWYTQEGAWGMAPGFDRPDHEGVLRPVQRECLACHDAYPEVAAGSDAFGQPHRFPERLPHGIGCQRCHGPGGEHVRQARDPAAAFEAVAESVVNPAKLPPDRRMDVCRQCHLQPAVALPAVRRFARGDYGFRPGEPLAAHRVELEAVEEGRPAGDRFEINHHAYQLEKSRCFTASAGALTCLTCHDPHRRVEPELRVEHYRAACLSCHQEEQCTGAEAGGAHGGLAVAAGAAGRDCAGCHMPRRRTEDVVHVAMTDHRIARGPFGPELLAPRAERDPVLVEARPLRPEEAPPGAEGAVYRALGVARIGARSESLPYLERLLRQGAADPASELAETAALPEPWLRLGEGWLLAGRWAEAEAALREAAARGAGGGLLRSWQGIVEAGQGRREEALARLREAVAADPQLAEAHFNLGRLLLAWGEPAAALPALDRALELRPNLAAAWLRRGEARAALGRPADATADYRQAIAVDPGLAEAYVALARALRAAGDEAGAGRVLELGERHARRREVVAGARGGAAGGGQRR